MRKGRGGESEGGSMRERGVYCHVLQTLVILEFSAHPTVFDFLLAFTLISVCTELVFWYNYIHSAEC